MLKKVLTGLFAALVLSLPALSNGSTLAASVDGSLKGGAKVTLSLSGSLANALTFLAVGQDLGTTTIKLPGDDLVLGLDLPFVVVPLGTTDGAGALTRTFKTKPIPVSIDPLTLDIQAVSVDFQVGGGPPKISACASNVASVTIQ